VSLQPLALDGKLDAKSVGLEDISQARGESPEQLIAFEVAADRAVNVQQDLHLFAQTVESFVCLPAFQFGAGFV
jgi:hypothetical protein